MKVLAIVSNYGDYGLQAADIGHSNYALLARVRSTNQTAIVTTAPEAILFQATVLKFQEEDNRQGDAFQGEAWT